MLPFTTTDLVFALVTVGALLALSVLVYTIARLQQPAHRLIASIAVEPDGQVESAAALQSAPGTVQHA